MKKRKYGFAILFVLMLLIMSGCSEADTDVKNQDNGNDTSSSEKIIVLGETDATDEKDVNDDELRNMPVIDGELVKGNVVKFGLYEQDNNLDNGSEPIEWIVIGEEEDKVLLLAKYSLDAHMFNDELTEVKWEECELRQYLNEEFLNKAFDTKEQEYLLESNLENKGNQNSPTDNSGNNTTDKVFCLSYDECIKYLDLSMKPSNSNVMYRYGRDLLCEPTIYAQIQGVFGFGPGAKSEDEIATKNANILGYTNEEIVTPHARWWLRTSGKELTYAMVVNEFGEISGSQWVAFDSDASIQLYFVGIRPAVWIKKD